MNSGIENKKKAMKVYLLSINEEMVSEWRKMFGGAVNVECVCDTFEHFMDTHDVECVVSPANSFGLMDGGYDYAISEWFGWDLMKKVQEYIYEHYHGEQPVGTSFIIDTGVKDIKLIHTPTMREPSIVLEPLLIYQSMRTTLLCAMENDIASIVIPAFGGGCGQVDSADVANLMAKGYQQIIFGTDKYKNWKTITRNEYILKRPEEV